MRARCVAAHEAIAAREERDARIAMEKAEAARASYEHMKALEAAHDRAWTLTKDAATHAREGDCARVLQLDVEVRTLDADLHDAVFVRDVAIGQCLNGADAR